MKTLLCQALVWNDKIRRYNRCEKTIANCYLQRPNEVPGDLAVLCFDHWREASHKWLYASTDSVREYLALRGLNGTIGNLSHHERYALAALEET